MVFAFDQGGAKMVGIISLVQLIPAAVIAPIGSFLGDRFRRERVLLLVEIVMAAMSAVTAIAVLAGAPAFLVYAAGCTVGYTLTLVRPTHGALLPLISDDPVGLTSAYTASGMVESSAVLVGPALATGTFAIAAALAVSGPGLVYAVLAVLLTFGSLAIARIRTGMSEDRDVATGPRPRISRELGAGFRYVWSDRRPRLLVWMVGLGALTLGFVDSLMVVIAFQLLGTGETGVGVLNTALGVGGVIGAMAALVAGTRQRLAPAFRAGNFVYGSGLAVTAAIPGAAPLLLGASGAGATLSAVSAQTMLQRLVPDDKLSRALGIVESAYMGWEGIGAALGAGLVVAVGPRWTLLIGGAILPAATLIRGRALRAVDVGQRVPAEDLALLRRTDIFEPLPPAALERVARNTVPLDVSAGTVLIREGEVGDRFYAVVAGELDVTTQGRTVTTSGPGAYVGEVALLRDVPRTATVTARTDARLLALERDEFLRAMTGHEPAHAAAHSIAEERISELRAVDPSREAPGGSKPQR